MLTVHKNNTADFSSPHCESRSKMQLLQCGDPDIQAHWLCLVCDRV